MREADAIVVGARCAGATLALALARRGWDVVLIDRATFPSETISTHLLFPNTLARLDQLGALDVLLDRHELPMLEFKLAAFGDEMAGAFTAVAGFDRCAAPRRVALDEAIVDAALAAGAESRLGERVVDLIGTGSASDPVAGVVLESGERIAASWVFGADGRASSVATRLEIEKQRPLQGEVSFLLGYWRGIPDNGFAATEIRRDGMVSRWAGEDGTCLVTAWGDAAFSAGSAEERRSRYLEHLSGFPALIEPAALQGAEMIGEVVVAPESLMRGFFRTPTGPGWALLGDACHFKHPATAQGISDAVEQSLYLAEALSGADPRLEGYERWRDDRAREHYDWSFAWGRFPREESEAMLSGLAGDEDAAQDLRDSFARQLEPSEVLTPERLGRWFKAESPAT